MSEEIIDKKQKLLLEYLVSSREIFAKCYSITKPEYYDAPLDRVAEFVLSFFTKHGGIPNNDVIEAETGIFLKRQELDSPSDLEYFLDEYEQFCKDSAMAAAILQGVDLVNEGKSNQVEALVREAMLVKLDKSIGLDLFKDVKERIDSMDERVVNYSTGSKDIDDLIGHVRKGELIVTSAVSSGGKSLHLGNMGIALAEQGLDVAIISLELNEQLYAKRMDAMITGIAIADHKRKADDIDKAMQSKREAMANITIKQMPPSSTASDIRAYLLEYSLEYKKYPDVLVVDYIGIMGYNTKSSNKFDQDEEKAIALRQIAVEYDMIVLTAQQLNREAANVTEVTYAHLAGGISLANNSDALIAIVQSEQDIDNNQVQVRGLKLRNSPKTTKPIILYRCPKTLRFSDSPNANGVVNSSVKKSTSPLLKKKTEDSPPKPSNESAGESKLKKALNRR